MWKKILILISISLFCQTNRASEYIQLSDSAQISVLTSAPWPEKAYAVYGHSAMRVCDTAQGIDVVFNYGVFDFETPNFVYRFMAGETDYWVMDIPTYYYILEYKSRGIDVYEQIINLNSAEKNKIWNFLLNNTEEKNKVYRYNIFYNNCTTKLRDILEDNIQGAIVYPESNKHQTFRDLVHECTYLQPWMQFGIDLVIGSKADNELTVREKIFLPVYEMNIFDHSTIQHSDGSVIPLVAKNHVLLAAGDSDQQEANDFFSSPLFVSILFLLLAVLVSIFTYKGKYPKLATTYDFLLFIIFGALGCVILFMMLFSVHPCTGSNWNIVWLNPIQLIIAFLFFAKSLSKYVYYYHFINFATLTVFLLAWCLIPQQLEIAFIPFILSIWLRSGIRVMQHKKTNKKI